jgi:hypothetical protein
MSGERVVTRNQGEFMKYRSASFLRSAWRSQIRALSLRVILATTAMSLLPSTTFAQGVADDRDLGGRKVLPSRKFKEGGHAIKPDRLQEGTAVNGIAMQFVRMVKGRETPVEGLQFRTKLKGDEWVIFKTDAQGVARSSVCEKTELQLAIPLTAEKFKLSTGSQDYQLNVTAKCGIEQKFIFEEQTENGQAIAIWQVVVRGGKRLATTVGTQFWKRPITFVWPSNGDYYTMDVVNLTLGHQWDVVAHEMGHAIYDQAAMGRFGGGQHFIDRCYTDTLALSEGWASFFAAVVMVDLRDSDAKFEYMVPRRAPIRFENVPADVCGGPTNEWRVTAWLWDLVDLHDDGETFEEAFARLWNDTAGARASSLRSMKSSLIQKGWDADRLETIWKLNFPTE